MSESRPLHEQEGWIEEGEQIQRENDMMRAEIQAMLNARYGTRHVRYDLDLLREMGQDGFDAYIALEQLAQEFPDAIDMDRARREPSVYMRVLDRVTAKRESEVK